MEDIITMNLKKLENYARLAVEFGVNVQKNEDVIINSSIENPVLAQLITKYAYEKGARKVSINWKDDEITKLAYTYQDQETLNEIPNFIIEKNKYQLEEHRSNRISIVGDDPDLLKGLNQKKIAEAIRENSIKLKDFMKYTMNDIVSWLVIASPTKKWAKKIFPDLDSNTACDKLWQLIFDVSRVDENWDITKKNWQKHISLLNEKAEFLNSHQFDEFFYHSSNGTNLRVKLPKNHIWMSASSVNEKGDMFLPNIPTEEVFTSPQYDGVNGRLVAVKPLVYNGVIIDKFEFEFKDGLVVDFKAEVGYETLKEMLESDENAKRLGEIALVSFDTPINESNVLFFNTLFDENASCHFALGKAYPTTIKGGSKVKDEDLNSIGINDSLIHEDFMVGSRDLNIKAYKDGKEYDIFIDGKWA